jgi:hypothetical protein
MIVVTCEVTKILPTGPTDGVWTAKPLKPKYRSINLVFLPGTISGEPNAYNVDLIYNFTNTVFCLWKDFVLLEMSSPVHHTAGL